MCVPSSTSAYVSACLSTLVFVGSDSHARTHARTQARMHARSKMKVVCVCVCVFVCMSVLASRSKMKTCSRARAPGHTCACTHVRTHAHARLLSHTRTHINSPLDEAPDAGTSSEGLFCFQVFSLPSPSLPSSLPTLFLFLSDSLAPSQARPLVLARSLSVYVVCLCLALSLCACVLLCCLVRDPCFHTHKHASAHQGPSQGTQLCKTFGVEGLGFRV